MAMPVYMGSAVWKEQQLSLGGEQCLLGPGLGVGREIGKEQGVGTSSSHAGRGLPCLFTPCLPART